MAGCDLTAMRSLCFLIWIPFVDKPYEKIKTKNRLSKNIVSADPAVNIPSIFQKEHELHTLILDYK